MVQLNPRQSKFDNCNLIKNHLIIDLYPHMINDH